MQHKTCSQCSTDITCGSKEGQCWCMAYPAMLPVEGTADCLCEACLKQQIRKQIDAYCASITPENALQNKAKTYSQGGDGLIEDIDYYIENGLYVFTKWFHLKRGFCCENGCRHCPYGYKK